MSKQTTYEERLNVLNNMFPSGKTRVTDDVKKWLINKGFLSVPYSFSNPSMSYNGSMLDHSSTVAIVLQTLTSGAGLEWEDPESPLIVGMFSSLYLLEWTLDAETEKAITADTTHFCPSHFLNDVVPSRWLEKSVFLLATQFRLTEEEIYCILYGQSFGNKDDFLKAVNKYPNVLFTQTANVYVDQCLSDGDI